MPCSEVLARYGTTALLRLLGALALFLTLHLLRAPLLVVVRVLAAAMARVDAYAAGQVSHPTGRASWAGAR